MHRIVDDRLAREHMRWANPHWRHDRKMTAVTREQFLQDGDLRVKHIPTGQWFSTYAYDYPEDLVRPAHMGGQQVDRDDDGNDYSSDEVETVAVELLREILGKRSK